MEGGNTLLLSFLVSFTCQVLLGMERGHPICFRTLLGGLTVYHVKGRGRVTLLRGLSFRLSD